MQLAFILGRTPRLAQKELEATAKILPFHWTTTSIQANLLRLKPKTDADLAGFLDRCLASSQPDPVAVAVARLQKRLGGTIRAAFLWRQVGKSEVPASLSELAVLLARHAGDGKFTYGVSVWGNGLQPFHLATQVKRGLRSADVGSRFVLPQGSSALSAAHVIHNKLALLTEEGECRVQGAELVAIQEQGKWWIGCTLTIQDIESYTKRDFSIPAPDPVSGMLSPKLAQMMINCAVSGADHAVYDPFCGNGRIVLEAWYMGLAGYGSDIVPEKVSAAQKNLAWMAEQYHLHLPTDTELLWVADATEASSRAQAVKRLPRPWHMVGEPYLGKPLRQALKPAEAQPWLEELYPLYERFFTLWSDCPPNDRPASMLMVIPRARVQDGSEAALYPLLVDRLQALGYSSEVLFCYDRPDSFVRRDLVSLTYR